MLHCGVYFCLMLLKIIQKNQYLTEKRVARIILARLMH